MAHGPRTDGNGTSAFNIWEFSLLFNSDCTTDLDFQLVERLVGRKNPMLGLLTIYYTNVTQPFYEMDRI